MRRRQKHKIHGFNLAMERKPNLRVCKMPWDKKLSELKEEGIYAEVRSDYESETKRKILADYKGGVCRELLRRS